MTRNPSRFSKAPRLEAFGRCKTLRFGKVSRPRECVAARTHLQKECATRHHPNFRRCSAACYGHDHDTSWSWSRMPLAGKSIRSVSASFRDRVEDKFSRLVCSSFVADWVIGLSVRFSSWWLVLLCDKVQQFFLQNVSLSEQKSSTHFLWTYIYGNIWGTMFL